MTRVGVLAHSEKSIEGGLPDLRETLARYGISDPDWIEVPKSKFAPDKAKQLLGEGVDLLFVWGGDGMVQRTADAVAGSDVELAILPAGTANLFAHNLGIPGTIDGAIRVGLHGRRRQIDLGKVNGERFGVMAGAGLDAVMIRDVDGGAKDRLGRLSYVWSGIKNSREDPVRTTIDVDGNRWFRGLAACVLTANVGDVIGGVSAFPDARPDDGLLEIGVVTADGPLDWARTVGRAVFGRAETSPFVRTTRGRRFDLHMSKARPWELDGGSRKKRKRLKIKVDPKAITVCVPRDGEAA